MKRLDFIDKSLPEKNEARIYINNVDKAMLEYYRVFAKKKKKNLYHLNLNYLTFTMHQRPK